MGTLFAMTLPALVVGLVILGVLDLVRTRRIQGELDAAPATAAAGFDVLGVLFDPGHRHKLEHDAFVEVDRDDDGDNAPPRSRVDLEAGVARIVLPPRGDDGKV
jgi:hypothetical protein